MLKKGLIIKLVEVYEYGFIAGKSTVISQKGAMHDSRHERSETTTDIFNAPRGQRWLVEPMHQIMKQGEQGFEGVLVLDNLEVSTCRPKKIHLQV